MFSFPCNRSHREEIAPLFGTGSLSLQDTEEQTAQQAELNERMRAAAQASLLASAPVTTYGSTNTNPAEAAEYYESLLENHESHSDDEDSDDSDEQEEDVETQKPKKRSVASSSVVTSGGKSSGSKSSKSSSTTASAKAATIFSVSPFCRYRFPMWFHVPAVVVGSTFPDDL